MSTSQIYNKGLVRYSPETEPLSYDHEQCQRCLEIGARKHYTYFRSKNTNSNALLAIVCKDCWEKYYEFYSEDYIIEKSGK